VTGTAIHALALAAFWIEHRTPPLVGFGPASATLAFATAVGLLIVGRASERWTAGLLALPPIMILSLAAVWAGLSPTAPATAFRGGWSVLHVVSVLTGYASLLLGSIAAAMYLLQFRALKRKEFGNVFQFFPSLDSLDRMGGIGVAVGLGALTVGLITGWSFTLTFGRGLALADPDVVLGLVTWIAYGAALAVRASPAGRGHRAAVFTVLAFAASAVAFLSLKARDPASEFFL
jgi:ABC-type uncharacterized transport system permease subunit